jgi:hypothetical protein
MSVDFLHNYITQNYPSDSHSLLSYGIIMAVGVVGYFLPKPVNVLVMGLVALVLFEVI